MSLSEEKVTRSNGYGFYGADMSLDASMPKDNSTPYQQAQENPDILYQKKLALSIRSLEAIHAREKKKRRRRTIIVVATFLIITTAISDSVHSSREFIYIAVTSLLTSIIYYYASVFLLHFSNKKNTEELITIEKLKTDLAVHSGKRESSYNLPVYYAAIDSMEDWL